MGATLLEAQANARAERERQRAQAVLDDMRKSALTAEVSDDGVRMDNQQAGGQFGSPVRDAMMEKYNSAMAANGFTGRTDGSRLSRISRRSRWNPNSQQADQSAYHDPFPSVGAHHQRNPSVHGGNSAIAPGLDPSSPFYDPNI